MGGIGMAARYRRVAQISRAKGRIGEVIATPLRILPTSAWENLSLWIVPPDHELVRETRVRSASASGDQVLLLLEGVTNRATAQRLRGRYLLSRVEDGTDTPNEGEGSAVGLRVIDTRRGPLGVIIEERVGLAQTLWVVDGSFGEVLIPAVDEFVRARDKETIQVSLPTGLLELNA
jgi:16S rRNA processing protein RimM